MPRRTAPPKNRPAASSKRSATTGPSASEHAVSIYTDALEVIAEEVRAIATGEQKPPGEYTKGAAVGYLAKQASQIDAERRKAAAAEQKRLDRLTPGVVLAWLRQQDPAVRAQVLREATAIDQKGSGLA